MLKSVLVGPMWKAIRTLMLLSSLVSIGILASNRQLLSGLMRSPSAPPAASGQTPASPAAGPDAAKLAGMITSVAPNNVQAQMAAGALFLRDNNPEQAMISFQKAIAIDPNNVNAHFQIGMILMKHEKMQEAGKEFREALRLDPKHVNSRFGLGQVLQHTDSLDSAADQYRQILELEPNNAEAHNNLGIVYDTQGRRDMAIEQFRKAAALTPNDETVQQNLKEALADAEMFKAPAPKQEEAPEPVAAPVEAITPEPEIEGPDELLLANGRTVRGHITERTAKGVWLEFENGKVFFSNAEILETSSSK